MPAGAWASCQEMRGAGGSRYAESWGGRVAGPGGAERKRTSGETISKGMGERGTPAASAGSQPPGPSGEQGVGLTTSLKRIWPGSHCSEPASQVRTSRAAGSSATFPGPGGTHVP